MFLKPNNPPPAAKPNPNRKSVPSVVSCDMHILGNIISESIIDFDGTIDGNIRCNTLVLRHNGRVNGEVHAETVQVYGKVKGLIRAKLVQLHSTCCVEGIVMHEMVSIEDGAIIDGKLKRTNKAMPATSHTAVADEEYEETDTGGEAPRLLESLRLIAG